MCYITLRGLVYFGASIHVYHGVQMLVNMYYDLFATSASKEITVSQVDIIFNCCFLTLGILIFRGVEQESKNFIKWPTIGFTLLLAGRFIIEIVKQVERERSGVGLVRLKPPNNTISPFSYSSMSIDVDPLISAAVGIYIFILFVYNHSLEYQHNQQQHDINANNAASNNANNGGGGGLHGIEIPSSCGTSDASSDTVLLINTPHYHHNHHNNNHNSQALQQIQQHLNPGDRNNNNGLIGGGGGGRNQQLNSINTRSNPLFELDGISRHVPLQIPNLNMFSLPNHQPQRGLDEGSMSPPTPPEYKVDAV